MKIPRNLSVLILMLGLLLTNVSTALAFPPLPSSFYGTVKANGANVPGCIRVSARINGVQYALSTYMLYNGDSVYALDVPGDDTETPSIIEGGKAGDTVEFYIGSAKAAQTAPWQSGTNVNLNLTVTVAQPLQCQIFLPLITR